jgi:hypothetical protein
VPYGLYQVVRERGLVRLGSRPGERGSLWYHCAALTRSVVRSALLAVVALVLTAAPAFAQSVVPSPAITTAPAKPAPPWTFYMAIVTIGVAALTFVLITLGYLVQAPGFRRKQSPTQAPGQAS